MVMHLATKEARHRHGWERGITKGRWGQSWGLRVGLRMGWDSGGVGGWEGVGLRLGAVM